MLHLIRKGIDKACPVCSAEPYAACIEAVGGIDPEPHQVNLPFLGLRDEQEWAEFQVLSALRNLREIAPGHVYVVAIGRLLEAQPQQPLDHPQAD